MNIFLNTFCTSANGFSNFSLPSSRKNYMKFLLAFLKTLTNSKNYSACRRKFLFRLSFALILREWSCRLYAGCRPPLTGCSRRPSARCWGSEGGGEYLVIVPFSSARKIAQILVRDGAGFRPSSVHS